MVSTLPQLVKSINNHISSKASQSKFSLNEIIPIIKSYNGSDWINYKQFAYPKQSPIQKYKDISLDISHRYSSFYQINLRVWYPLVGYSHFYLDKKTESLFKILEGGIIDYRFYNDLHPNLAYIQKKNTNDILYNNCHTNSFYNGYYHILCNYTESTYCLYIVKKIKK
jgi:hypothetical protein